ncbi:MAG: MBL fold metallo-hydrolase [Alphaproteobacteria bacterium]|nr:MBL fold metallo-hydrolase [Alphaproteobacteria bacterium]
MPNIHITRNIHGSVLIEMDAYKILTDLFFTPYWFARRHEEFGIKAKDLPKLNAIIGCHGVFDHWHPKSMKDYKYKAETPVFCATQSMVNSAKRAGFTRAKILNWGESKNLDGLQINAIQAQYALKFKVNNYTLEADGKRIFFGSETHDFEPLLAYAKTNPPVDLAILPIDGSTIIGQRLVCLPHEAINATRILGAKTMVPIHYSFKQIKPLFRTPANIQDLKHAAKQAPDIHVNILPTGLRQKLVL